jgi:hypothetical protein
MNVTGTHEETTPGGMTRIAAFVRWFGVVLMAAGSVQAQVDWVRPERYAVTPGGVLGFALQSGAEFVGTASELSPGRIRLEQGQLAMQPLPIPAPTLGLPAISRFYVAFPRPGLAVIQVDLKPEARSIGWAEVERYLRQLHASDEVRDAWSKVEPPNPWQEVRTIRLKTFVRVGEPMANDQTATKGTGDGFELVPDADPTAMRENGTFAVRVLRDGRPVVGVMVEYLSLGESRQHVLVTNEQGRAEAALDLAGEWLVRAVDVRRVQAGNHDWDVDCAALTMSVRPPAQ